MNTVKLRNGHELYAPFVAVMRLSCNRLQESGRAILLELVRRNMSEALPEQVERVLDAGA